MLTNTFLLKYKTGNCRRGVEIKYAENHLYISENEIIIYHKSLGFSQLYKSVLAKCEVEIQLLTLHSHIFPSYIPTIYSPRPTTYFAYIILQLIAHPNYIFRIPIAELFLIWAFTLTFILYCSKNRGAVQRMTCPS